MTFNGPRRLVGLGFGAIGSGLFVYEAFRTGDYAPPFVVDVRADLVAGLRADAGHFRVNIARSDRIDVADVGPLNVADSTVEAEAEQIAQVIASADELVTALPSVDHYCTGAPNSPHLLVAEGLRRRTKRDPLVVYCSENHRNAAALMREAVVTHAAEEPADVNRLRGRATYVDTVIGKMSGVITDEKELRELGLATITPTLPAAFLVEEFDRILVSTIGGDLHPGIPVLREVDDLAPFEDAKLLGHNATHALAGFLGSLLGLTLVADLREVDGAMDFLRTAFIEESGATLRRRWEGADELFTEIGYAAFADDLLERMVNPWLADTIERASRDPRRKLGWDDRLVGLIRLGLTQDVPTPRYAMGVAAGLDVLRATEVDHGYDADLLRAGWPDGLDSEEVDLVIEAVAEGRDWLGRWLESGFGSLPTR